MFPLLVYHIESGSATESEEILNQIVMERTLPRMRTIRETAQETGLHEYFVRQLVKRDKIKYIKAGRKTLINLDLFIDFLNAKEQEAAQ